MQRLSISAVSSPTLRKRALSAWDYIAHIIPNTVVRAFSEGEILQVLFFAIQFAFRLQFMRERGEPALRFIEAVMEQPPSGLLAQWHLRSGATALAP
jgi:aerobic C4-dicarboxylate transport protein